MDVNLKSLVSKLNDVCRRTLESAAGLCLARSNYSVEIEHWLLKILETNDTDLTRLLRYYEIDSSRLTRDLTRAVDRLKTGNTRPPSLAPMIVDAVREAWVLASIEFNVQQVRSGHLLLGLLIHPETARILKESAPELAKIAPDLLKKELRDISSGSLEDIAESTVTSKATTSPAPGASAAASGNLLALDQFTVDLTARAKQGLIDPVLGRDFEIRQVVDILTRRRQNNPILTGEAGVGKTAVVEGFALRIAQGDVPPPLKNVSVRTLDLALLQAGAGMKGEFESRLKSVIQEVKASPQPIILFIDEAHTLIGAGGQAGQSDAANLLKPALARGELRTIAATTWSEYKKYFEKDAALARRFQVVKVEEPGEAQVLTMMRGLVSMLERHHHLRILDEAVLEAVRLSTRYITGRQLPDKAVSLLDTACARVAIGHHATPPAIEDLQRQIDQLSIQIGILQREAATGADFRERIASLLSERTHVETKLAERSARWKQEREFIHRIREIRARLEQQVLPGPESGPVPATAAMTSPAVTAAAPLSPAEIEQLQQELATLTTALRQVQQEEPLLQACVDAQVVAAVVSSWTGIPVGKMLTNEIQTVLSLQEKLEARIIGQSPALETICQRVRTARAGLVDPRRPVGVFLLVGPSGVGKTETALALADILYGGERNLVVINMSEYQEAHTVSSLKGSPPGYVGYGEGGVLTEAVRRRPYSVVLLDEIEKAHTDVMELFYQVFDKGTLEDGEGRDIDFKNTLILLTSNVGDATVMKLCADSHTAPDHATLAQALRPELLKVFKPAFLGRMTVVPYYPLSDEVLRQIIVLQLDRIGDRLRANHRAHFRYEPAVVEAIRQRCREVESGARNVDNILTGTLLPEISREILARMAAGQIICDVSIRVGDQGGFEFDVTSPAA